VKKLKNEIEILSTLNLLCGKFEVSVEKLQPPAPPTFLSHDAAKDSTSDN